MSFGPGAGSIILKLLDKKFSAKQVRMAESKGVRIDDVARIELKLWVDFCEAIGDLTVHDDCIEVGRDKFHANIIKFLQDRTTISEAMRRSQICTTRAGAKAADIAGSLKTEISAEDYKQACQKTLVDVVKALKKLPSKKVMQSPMVPLCDGEAQKLMNKK